MYLSKEFLKVRKIGTGGIILAFLLIIVMPTAYSKMEETPLEAQLSGLNYVHVIDQINMANVRQHIEFFESLRSRYSGYEGNEKAAQYIAMYFQNLSETSIMENVTVDQFPVVVPVDYGANVTILTSASKGSIIEVHPLQPNLISPSTTTPSGITGRLIYAKKGYLEDFDGWNVNGSIVLMDWNSLDRWINAAKLGAKAVIFLPPHPTDPLISLVGSTEWRYPENPKYLPDLPLNFPRFYVEEKGGMFLLDNLNQTIRLVSTQRWDEVMAKNILGFIRGAVNPKDYVVISSYYDSFSVVPAVSPGAQEACGIAGILELARIFSQPDNRPKNSIIFLALGGHHQAYAGATQFIKDYLYPVFGDPEKTSLGLHKLDPKDQKQRVKINLNLDISTGSDTAYIAGRRMGAFSRYDIDWIGFGKWLDDFIKRVNDEKPGGRIYEVGMEPRLLAREDSEDPYMIWKSYGYDHEAFGLLGHLLAITFTTAYDTRPYFGEPFDTIDKLNLEKLQTQLEFFCIVATEIVNLDDTYTVTRYVGRNDLWVSTGIFNFFIQFQGYVVVWNETRGFYDPVPGNLKALVNIRRILVRGNREHMVFVEKNGFFRMLPQEKDQGSFIVNAWVIDESTGNVIYAPDQGSHQWRAETYQHGKFYPPAPIWDWGYVVTFKASTIILFDLEESPNVIKIDEHRAPESHGTWSRANVFVLAIPPDISISFIGKAFGARYPTEILLNSSRENPYGNGYKVDPGEQLIIPFTRLEIAKSFYWLNEERLKFIQKFDPEIMLSETYQMHQQAEHLIKEAQQAIANYQYSKAESYAYEASKIGQEVYSRLRVNIEDVSYAVPFLAFFFLPFTFLAEKLFIGWRGPRRILSFLGTFSVLILVFYAIHPGFTTVANPFVNILGFSVLILTVPLLIIISRYMTSYLQDLRFARLGRHEVEVSRVGEVGQAFVIGVEHMRRARLRTALTLTTIILMVSALVGFTSLGTLTYSRSIVWQGAPLYDGIYIRKPLWGEGDYEMDSIVPILRAKYGEKAVIAPRAWKYVWQASARNPNLGFHIKFQEKEIVVPVLWGLTPEEDCFSAFLIGLSRWFLPSDQKVLILTESNAKKLGIDSTILPVTTVFEGTKYTVIGVIGDAIEGVYDLDGEQVLPIKFDLPGEDQDWMTHVNSEYVVILLYNEVIDIHGGHTASVSMIFDNRSQISEAAAGIVKIFPGYEVRSCVGKGVFLHMEVLSFVAGGIEAQMIPMGIACLAVFNNLLGAVYERKKNIFIYSSVGLSPLHIAFLFLAENVAYAVIGGILGYLCAILFSRLAAAFLPGVLILNYSSGWVFLSIGASMFVIILASLYPLRAASKLSTPSLARAWRIPTKPVKDLWEIGLPFFAADDLEANGMSTYIQEYWRAHSIRDSPDFYAQDTSSEEGMIGDKRYIGVKATVYLYPYESGVSQNSYFYLIQIDPVQNRWECRVTLNRISGTQERWIRLNHHYVDLLRKQLLIWRSMNEAERRKYIKPQLRAG